MNGGDEGEEALLLIPVESELQQGFRAAFQQDASRILSEFLSQRDHSLATMLACWSRLDFELVHTCRPDSVTYDWFMDVLFDTCLEVVVEAEGSSDRTRARAAIFLMYGLWASQPGQKQIWVSARVWDRLVAMDRADAQVHAVLGSLVHREAFAHVAMTAWEIAEAGRRNHERLALQQSGHGLRGAGQAAEKLLGELSALESDMAQMQSSLLENAFDLRQAEDQYARVRSRLATSTLRADVSKDLAQSQHDWSATFLPLLHGSGEASAQPSRRGTASVLGTGLSQAAGKRARRATVQEPFERPQTAPPPTLDTPEYLISPEHMPSLF